MDWLKFYAYVDYCVIQPLRNVIAFYAIYLLIRIWWRQKSKQDLELRATTKAKALEVALGIIQRLTERSLIQDRNTKQEVPQGTDGIAIITRERWRQVAVEGWHPDHDDKHVNGELAMAAFCYLWYAHRQINGTATKTELDNVPINWPWDARWWKPSTDIVRNLAKAAALSTAEIDRLQRVDAREAMKAEGFPHEAPKGHDGATGMM